MYNIIVYMYYIMHVGVLSTCIVMCFVSSVVWCWWFVDT